MNRRPSHKSRQVVPHDHARSNKEVHALALRSFVYALGITKASQATAARWMRVARSTVERWLSGKAPVNVLHVLRSEKLAAPFAHHLCQSVVVRNGRAK